MGRLASTTTSYSFLAGRNFTTSYACDGASNRTGFTDPEGGSTSYGYDTLNRLQTLTLPAAFGAGPPSFGFSYDALSRRTQMTRPNGITTNYSYDTLSRLLSVLHQAGASTIDGATYTVDAAGNRTAKTDQRAGVTSNYSYDALYELTQVVQGANTTESYSYDQVGNRLSSLGLSPYNYNVSNELTSTPSATYGYDANGNAVTKNDSSGITTFAWNYENRLTSITLPGSGGTVSFKYDPTGRRIYKSSSSGTSIYAYDGDNLVEEVNSSGAVVARYSQNLTIDEPLAMLRSSTTSFYQSDGVGSITSLSNGLGSLAQTYGYDSFGKQTTSSGSLTNPFQYTAREFDSETSLYYYRARYYDPGAGRFISEDPLGFKADLNFYRYVGNNSANFTDPSGLYTLQGFPPTQAAEMTIAIGQLWAKLKQQPCCVQPKLRDKLLDLLQPSNYGSGVTFVYNQTLPAAPGAVTCAQVGVGKGHPVGNFWRFVTDRVDISEAAFTNPRCGCLASTLLHEVNHLTRSNRSKPDPEADSHDLEVRCFGLACAGN